MSDVEITQRIIDMRGDVPTGPNGQGGMVTYPVHWKDNIPVCTKMLASQDYLERVRPCVHGAGMRAGLASFAKFGDNYRWSLFAYDKLACVTDCKPPLPVPDCTTLGRPGGAAPGRGLKVSSHCPAATAALSLHTHNAMATVAP